VRLATGREVKLAVGLRSEISDLVERYYGQGRSALGSIVEDVGEESREEDDVEHLRDLASEAPVIRLVNLLIQRAVETRASDIHIEPFETRLKVRYRIDGVLIDAESPPAALTAAVISRIKIMAKLNIAERRLPQDGRIMVRVQGKELDLRVSTVPTQHGESVVMRLLDRESVVFDFHQLGFTDEFLPQFMKVLDQPHGIGEVGVLRVGAEDGDAVFVFAHRADRVVLQELDGQRHAGWRRVRTVLGRHQWQAEHVAERVGHVALGDHAELHQQAGQCATGLGAQALGADEVGVLQAAAGHEGRGDAGVEVGVEAAVGGGEGVGVRHRPSVSGLRGALRCLPGRENAAGHLELRRRPVRRAFGESPLGAVLRHAGHGLVVERDGLLAPALPPFGQRGGVGPPEGVAAMEVHGFLPRLQRRLIPAGIETRPTLRPQHMASQERISARHLQCAREIGLGSVDFAPLRADVRPLAKERGMVRVALQQTLDVANAESLPSAFRHRRWQRVIASGGIRIEATRRLARKGDRCRLVRGGLRRGDHECGDERSGRP